MDINTITRACNEGVFPRLYTQRKTGRPPIEFDLARAQNLLSIYSVRRVAVMLNLHPNTFLRYVQTTPLLKEAFTRRQEAQRAMKIERVSAPTGRPCADIDMDVVSRLLKNHSGRQVAKILNVNHNTLYRHINRRLEGRPYLRARGVDFGAFERLASDPLHSLELARAELGISKHVYHRTLNISPEFREIVRRAKQARKVAIIEAESRVIVERKQSAGVGRLYCADPAGKFRTCSKCLGNKPLTDFYYKKESLTYRRQCKACCVARVWELQRLNGRPWRKGARVAPMTEVYPYLLNTQVDGAELVMKINSLVPKSLPNDLRAEVCQEIALAILSGKLDVKDLPGAVASYVKAVRKTFPSKHQVSIDAPFLHANGRAYTLAERLSEDDYAQAYMLRGHNFYGDRLSGCESAEAEDRAARRGE